ncbi:MAG: tRNA-dihydrouridine synthase family protein [Deltaproteobacteria bacterium]
MSAILPRERWAALATKSKDPSGLDNSGVDIDFPFFLAPMVGLSHVALRETLRAYTPADAKSLLFTEMLSSRRLSAEKIGDRPETTTLPHETDLVPQLLANEERFIRISLDKLKAIGPRAIDINMGCPVNQALKHNWGVALMGDPRYAEEVVRMTVAHSTRPVSVKLRTGLTDDPEYLVDFARMLESAGAAWLTIHPRIASQQRRGSACWDYLGMVRDAVKIPVIGNGDVQTADDAFDLLRRTGCDGVMIGRAAVARPWILWQVGERLGLPAPRGLEGREAPADAWSEGAEYQHAFARFRETATATFTARDALRRTRFFVHWGGRWLDFGHELWRRINSAPDLDAMREIADAFFAKKQRMTSRTVLRG